MAGSRGGTTAQHVSTRNATFQQWQALLTNRTKRHRSASLLVQGVRPLTMAVEAGHPIREWLHADTRRLSTWAHDLMRRAPAPRYAVADALLRELAEKDDGTVELLGVVGHPSDDLGRISVGRDALAVLFDRPTSPGNVGTVIRSVDALGGSGVIVTGHAADPYDPRAIRASTGSVFTVPVVRTSAPEEILSWVSRIRDDGVPLRLLATDEDGTVDVDAYDLTGPTLVLTGNETTGLARAWREASDAVVRIPMAGSASSLNAATATAVVLYEAGRQRRREGRRGRASAPPARDEGPGRR